MSWRPDDRPVTDGPAVAPSGSRCGWCNPPFPDNEPGAHHAADCPLYRSPFVGPEAQHWNDKLRDRLDAHAAKMVEPNWKPVSNFGAQVPVFATNRSALSNALISGRTLVLVDAKTGSRIATRVVTVFNEPERAA